MPATTTTIKAALFLLALLCAGFQWMGLRSQLAYQSSYQMVEAVGAGRFNADDMAWVQDTLQKPVPSVSFATPELRRTTALLYLYQVDLTAAAKGVLPFQASADPDLIAARLGAMNQLTSALSRTPSDGDLWLRLALVARAGDAAGNAVNSYLKLSQKTAPYEGWILNRRPSPAL